MEVGDDEHRFAWTDTEQRGYEHERRRDRPVLVRRLEAAERRERLGMRQHRLGVAARGERRAKTVEAHLPSLAESPF